MNGLKALVAIMGALIVLMMTVVGYGLYRKASDPAFRFFDLGGGAPAPAPGSATPPAAPAADKTVGYDLRALGLPQGAEVRHIAADGGRLFIHVRMGDGTERILTLDAATGRTVGTVDVNR